MTYRQTDGKTKIIQVIAVTLHLRFVARVNNKSSRVDLAASYSHTDSQLGIANLSKSVL